MQWSDANYNINDWNITLKDVGIKYNAISLYFMLKTVKTWKLLTLMTV
jgi:hypothetical protein